MARFDLTDFEWGLVQPLLPNKPRGVARVDDRHLLGASDRFSLAGPAGALWPTHDRLQPLQPLGQGGRLAAGVRGAGGEVARQPLVDRLIHHPGAPAGGHGEKGGEDHALGRSRGGLSTKINAMVDGRGLPVAITLSAGQASGKAAVEGLLARHPAPGDVVADRGYDARAVLDLIAARGGRGHIPTQRDRKPQRQVDPALYRQRNLVERFFAKLKHFRKVATRYEKTARNYLAAVLIACSRLWMRAYEAAA